jgi:hypothetical protein
VRGSVPEKMAFPKYEAFYKYRSRNVKYAVGSLSRQHANSMATPVWLQETIIFFQQASTHPYRGSHAVVEFSTVTARFSITATNGYNIIILF